MITPIENQAKRIEPNSRTGLKPYHLMHRQLMMALPELLRELPIDWQHNVMRLITWLDDLDLIDTNYYHHWQLDRLDMSKTETIAPMVFECYRLLSNSFDAVWYDDRKELVIEIDHESIKQFQALFNEIKNHKQLHTAINQVRTNRTNTAKAQLPSGSIEWLYNWIQENPTETKKTALFELNRKFNTKISIKSIRFNETYNYIVKWLKNNPI